MPDLAYGSNPGCVARVSTGGSPRQCGGVEAAAVPWRYLYPTPHTARLYVCAYHAEHTPGAVSLSGRDKAIIRARRKDRRARLAVADRLDLIGEGKSPPGNGAEPSRDSPNETSSTDGA